MKRNPKIGHTLDHVFSFYIKCRDGWSCQAPNCGFVFSGNEYLDCSHFHRCSHQGTRHHEDNCDALCRSCHIKWEKLKNKGQEYYNWKIIQLGGMKFGELLLLAQGITKLHRQDKIDLTQGFIEKIEKLGYDTEVFKKKLLTFN